VCVFLIIVVEFLCQYQFSWLSGKARLQSNIVCVNRAIKLLTHCTTLCVCDCVWSKWCCNCANKLSLSNMTMSSLTLFVRWHEEHPACIKSCSRNCLFVLFLWNMPYVELLLQNWLLEQNIDRRTIVGWWHATSPFPTSPFLGVV